MATNKDSNNEVVTVFGRNNIVLGRICKLCGLIGNGDQKTGICQKCKLLDSTVGQTHTSKLMGKKPELD